MIKFLLHSITKKYSSLQITGRMTFVSVFRLFTMRELKGKVKESAREKKERKKEFMENKVCLDSHKLGPQNHSRH